MRLLIFFGPADGMDDFCSIAEDKSPLLEGEDTAIHLPFLGGGKLLPFLFLPASLAQELAKFFLPFVYHRPLTGVIGIEVTDSDRLTIREIVLVHQNPVVKFTVHLYFRYHHQFPVALLLLEVQLLLDPHRVLRTVGPAFRDASTPSTLDCRV